MLECLPLKENMRLGASELERRLIDTARETLAKFPPKPLSLSIRPYHNTPAVGDPIKRHSIVMGGSPPLANIAITGKNWNPISSREDASPSAPLSQDDLFALALDHGAQALTNFRHDALAPLNNAFYRAPGAPTTQNYLRTSKPLRKALARYVNALRFNTTRAIRVKEYAAAEETPRWSELKLRETVNVTLSDLTFPQEAQNTAQVTYELSRENIYSSLKPLPSSRRYDLIFGTYFLDSLAFPQDRFLIKHPDGSWYCALTRVITGARNQNISTNPSRSAMRMLSRGALMDTHFESISHQIELTELPYGEDIARHYNAHPEVAITVPYGLVRKLHELATTQLRSTGEIILIDTALPQDVPPITTPYIIQNGCAFRFLDMELTAGLLRKTGLHVTVQNLKDFIGAKKLTEIDEFKSGLHTVLRIKK